jgi:hypothetical protein
MGHRVGLDAAAKRKSLCLCQESNSGRPARDLVTVLTELPPQIGVLMGYSINEGP